MENIEYINTALVCGRAWLCSCWELGRHPANPRPSNSPNPSKPSANSEVGVGDRGAKSDLHQQPALGKMLGRAGVAHPAQLLPFPFSTRASSCCFPLWHKFLGIAGIAPCCREHPGVPADPSLGVPRSQGRGDSAGPSTHLPVN